LKRGFRRWAGNGRAVGGAGGVGPLKRLEFLKRGTWDFGGKNWITGD